MYYYLLIFLCVTRGIRASEVLCDICTCIYTKNDEKDFMTIDADCSYSAINVWNSSYELPKSIHTFDLTSNQITHINKSRLLQSKTLEVLYLNKNNLISIDIEALSLPNLKELDLSENNLKILDPDVFKQTKKLEYLNLASNDFTSFAPMMFHHLGALKQIVLDNNNIGNNLQEVNLFQRNGFSLTSGIKSISLQRINMNIIPDNFFLDAYDLRRAGIAGNNLTVIPELPYTLEYLDISDNPITEIDAEDFSELPVLKELKLNNLKIKEVPDYVFADMKSLVKLELERNKNLTVFSRLAFGHEVLDDPDYFTLEVLSLRWSRLNTLEKELEIPLGRLLRLDLQGNPWKCDCNLLWLKKLQIPPEDYEHVRCSTPRTFYNAKIFELPPKYFKCAESKRHIGGAIAAVIFCVVLTTIALWLFFCLPIYHSRCNFLRQMYSPMTTYSLLPINQSVPSDRY